MTSFKNNSISIQGTDLKRYTTYHFNIFLNYKKKSIIKGTIYNQNGSPSIGAVIELIQINPLDCDKTILGYAYTNEDGHYLFATQVLPQMFYEISVYAPLS